MISERSLVLEACIVKIMKHKKECLFLDLVKEIFDDLKLPIEVTCPRERRAAHLTFLLKTTEHERLHNNNFFYSKSLDLVLLVRCLLKNIL